MKAIFDQFDKVNDFPHDRRGRVDEVGGRTLVRIYDSSQAKPEFATDLLTAWDRVPGLKAVAVKAYIRSCTGADITSHHTRLVTAGTYKRMSDIFVALDKGDRATDTLTFYDCEEVIDHIASLQHAAPQDDLRPLRQIVDEIWNSPEFDKHRDPHLFVRNSPFAGSGRRQGGCEVLPDAVFGDIYACAAADVARVMTEAGAFRAFLREHGTPAGSDVPRAPDLHGCAAWVKGRFGGRLPSLDALEDVDRALWRHLKWAHGGYGWKEVVRLIHPRISDLMPVIALLGCQTFFNKALLADMEMGDIERRRLAGTDRLVLTPIKKRAGKQQLRSFAIDDAPDNPSVTIAFLKRATAGLRPLVPTEFRNRLFLFWSLGPRGAGGMGSGEGASAFNGVNTGSGGEDSRFTYYWDQWCAGHKFGGVNFSSIRVTALNLVYRASGGDVRAVAALASHSSPDVFDQNYKSAHSRAANDRRLGKAMMLQGRWLASGGKVDPTGRLKGEGAEAATPGFGCLDCFESPLPGQRRGRPCTAYGQCHDCPLANTDVRVPANLARLKQLEAEYISAAGYLAPHYWRDKYSGCLRALRAEWLPAFTDRAVVEAAARMQVSPLPPLG